MANRITTRKGNINILLTGHECKFCLYCIVIHLWIMIDKCWVKFLNVEDGAEVTIGHGEVFKSIQHYEDVRYEILADGLIRLMKSVMLCTWYK